MVYPVQVFILNVVPERGFILKLADMSGKPMSGFILLFYTAVALYAFRIHVFTINRLRSAHVMQQSSASIQCRQTVSRSATTAAGCVR